MKVFLKENIFIGKINNGINYIYMCSNSSDIQPIFLKKQFMDELKYIKNFKKINDIKIANKLLDSKLISEVEGQKIDIKYDFNKNVRFLLSNSYESQTPIETKIELTYRCQLQCKYCILKKCKSDEMKTKKIKQILEELRELGVIKLTLTGGEVFLRDDLVEIVTYSAKLGFITIIQTNGLLITEDFLEKIKEYQNIFFKISFHGLDDKNVDNFVGKKNANKLIKEKIFLLKEKKVKFSLVYNLTSYNSNEFDKVKQYFEENNFRYILNADVYPNISDLSITNYEYNCKNENVLYKFLDISNKEKNKKNFEASQCDAAILRMRIEPNGTVNPCGLIKYSLGNLHKQSLKSIWFGQKANIFRKSDLFSPRKECEQCEYRVYCNKCNAFYKYNDNWIQIKKNYCKVAKILKLIKEKENE